MKILHQYWLLLLLVISTNISAQFIYTANFGTGYTLGKLSGQNNWTNSTSSVGGGGSCVGAICTNNTVKLFALAYPNFDSTLQSVSVAGDQDGVGTAIPNTSSGALYFFILCQFSSAKAGSISSYDILRLMGGGNYNTSAKLYVQDLGGQGFKVGISKGSATPVYNANVPTILAYNQPQLIVVKYEFKPGPVDDVVSAYVNPDMSLTEPTSSEVSSNIGVGTDNALIDRMQFPFNSNSLKPVGNIGIVKVATAWPPKTYSIAGNIYTTTGKPIKKASVIITQQQTTQQSLTDSTGKFSVNLAAGNYTIKSQKANDVNRTNGVNTIDIALIQSHILAKNVFNSNAKKIAADVNSDGKINAIDLVFLKRFILGIDTLFPGKKLWVMVDSLSLQTSSANPFPIKDTITITGLSASQSNISFTGIKLGDVNFDWNANLPKMPRQMPKLKSLIVLKDEKYVE